MKKIIEEVFHAEEQADGFLKQAREKAAEIRRQTDKETSALISDAEQKARDLVQNMVEDAKIQAERVQEERLATVAQHKDEMFSGKTESIDRLIDDICRIVLTTNPERNSD